MLIGREVELKQLKEMYESSENSLAVLYGRKGIGKTALAREFIEDKPAAYYAARECTDMEQQLLLSKEWGLYIDTASSWLKYQELFESIIDKKTDKKKTADKKVSEKKAADKKGYEKKAADNKKIVIIIDEFHLLLKENKDVANIISDILNSDKKVMFLFMSSSINWVENDMVNEFGMAVKYISRIIKLKEMTFADMVKFYPKLSVEQCIYVNAALGGIPGYMRLWQENKSVKENLNKLFFCKEGELYNEAESFLKTELRELSAYNTILAALAAGRYKLNDIHACTGFSRAKISVYIKNLMELDVIEKVFSFETGDRENIQKGLYRIRDNFLNFWYCYVYPHKSIIESGDGKEIYNAYFLPETSEYMRQYFAKVCEEYLRLLSRHKRLMYVYDKWGSWHGKNGVIDIIGVDSDGHYIASLCNFKSKAASEGMLDECITALSFAGIIASEIYLFSRNGFTIEFMDKVRDDKGIVLVDMKEL